jgi:hypothetical protein
MERICAQLDESIADRERHSLSAYERFAFSDVIL